MTTSTPAASGPSPLFRRLLPALLLAAFVTTVFLWNPFGAHPRYASFEALVRPSVDGNAQFLTDIDGAGLHKERTVSRPVAAGKVNHVRFGVPAGMMSSFILSPLAAQGNVDVLRCWWRTEDGNVVAVVPPSALAAGFPGAVRLEDGSVRLPGMVGEKISGLRFDASPALDLSYVPPPDAWKLALVFVGTVIASLALSHPDQYTAIYFPEPEFLVNRVSYPATFSPENAPADAYSIQAEITCTRDSATWAMTDDAILEHVIEGLVSRKIIPNREVVMYRNVQRKTYSYVVYDRHYAENTRIIREWFPKQGLHLAGRFGFVEYANVDGILIRNLELASQLNGHPVSVDGGSVIK